MKKFALLTLAAALGLTGLGVGNVQAAPVIIKRIPSTFTIVALFSPTNSPVTSTNHNGMEITTTYKTQTVTITTKDILNLLAREFNTNFPAGAQLASSLIGGFSVLDQHGNVILDVSSNPADSSYRFSFTNSFSGSPVVGGKEIRTKTASTTNLVETLTVTDADTAIYYQDGNGNDFHFSGVLTENINTVLYFGDPAASKIESLSIILTGSGDGTFYNPADGRYDNGVFTTATWQVFGINIPDGPI